MAAAITIRTQLLKNAQKKLSCYNRAWVGLRGAAAREAAREAAATAAATVAVKAVAAVAATAAARVAAATAVGCGEGGGWWWMDEGDRRCVCVWREEGCVGLSRRRPAVRGPLQKGGSHGRAPSRGLARKMPAHAAHKVQGKCDASGQEGGEGHSTRWGKRGAAVGDGGCGFRACAGGAAAGPGGVPSRAQKSTVLDAKVPANEQAGLELSG